MNYVYEIRSSFAGFTHVYVTAPSMREAVDVFLDVAGVKSRLCGINSITRIGICVQHGPPAQNHAS